MKNARLINSPSRRLALTENQTESYLSCSANFYSPGADAATHFASNVMENRRGESEESDYYKYIKFTLIDALHDKAINK